MMRTHSGSSQRLLPLNQIFLNFKRNLYVLHRLRPQKLCKVDTQCTWYTFYLVLCHFLSFCSFWYFYASEALKLKTYFSVVVPMPTCRQKGKQESSLFKLF